MNLVDESPTPVILDCKDSNTTRLAEIQSSLSDFNIPTAFPERSFLKIMKDGFSKEMDPIVLFFSTLRFLFTVLLIIIAAYQSSCSSADGGFCDNKLFLAFIVLCGTFILLDLINARYSCFYRDYLWMRDNRYPYGIADIREYVIDLCRVPPIIHYGIRLYTIETYYRTVTEGPEGNETTRDIPYTVREEGERRMKVFEYMNYTDVTEIPPIQELTASPLIRVRAHISYEMATEYLTKRYDRERDQLRDEMKKNSRKSYEYDGSVTLPEVAKYQPIKFCTADPSRLPWVVKHANEIYIALSILGFHWFFAIWMQGYGQTAFLNLKKRIID